MKLRILKFYTRPIRKKYIITGVILHNEILRCGNCDSEVYPNLKSVKSLMNTMRCEECKGFFYWTVEKSEIMEIK